MEYNFIFIFIQSDSFLHLYLYTMLDALFHIAYIGAKSLVQGDIHSDTKPLLVRHNFENLFLLVAKMGEAIIFHLRSFL